MMRAVRRASSAAPATTFWKSSTDIAPEQEKVNAELIGLSKEMGIPLVATNDVHYVDAGDNVAHDAMLCIQTGARLADERRMKYGAQEFYLKSQAEMLRVFGEVPAAVTNTVAIAEMCDVQLPVGQNNYPVYVFSEGVKPKAGKKIDAILDGYERLKNGLAVAAGKQGDFAIPEDKRAPMRPNGSYLLEQVKAGLKERYGVDYDDAKAWADERSPGAGDRSARPRETPRTGRLRFQSRHHQDSNHHPH